MGAYGILELQEGQKYKVVYSGIMIAVQKKCLLKGKEGIKENELGQ